jgi:hypothetical protein
MSITAVIPATQQAGIRRTVVQSQPWSKQRVRPCLENDPAHMQKRAGGVANAVGPEFKPQHHK